MGYYINETSKGEPLPGKGKYEALIADGATPDDGQAFKENLVCVVQNHFFDAAGYAFNVREFLDFSVLDGRPRKWLTHPDAKKLSGYDD